jgi:hypothetical protein
MDMRRYLLVLDMDLLAIDEELDLEPINHIIGEQELSLAGTPQQKLPAMELLLGAQVGKLPIAPPPDHDVSASAEHRMNLAVRQLKMIGCRASGIISDQDLLPAVRAETRGHAYDGVIVATGMQGGSRLARLLHLDPVHQLRWRWGKRLTVFEGAPVTP